MTPLTIFSCHSGQDTGGQSIRIKRAFDRHAPDWPFRSMTQRINFINYPQDLPWRKRAAQELYWQADVVHLHNGHATARTLGDQRGEKPAIVHHHGTMFRGNPQHFLREHATYGSIGIVSTLDLWLLGSEMLEWLPAPYNIDELQAMRNPHGTDTIRIAHAPTERTIKSTAEFLAAIERLQREGFPVELELIERASWAECLTRKAKADIYFDQVILGYGCNALEAWGMGIPVVAGAADETLDEMERRFGHLPFYHATEETIYDALRELVESPELRTEYGRIGYEYVKTHHDEPVVVEQLKRLYQRAIKGQERKAA